MNKALSATVGIGAVVALSLCPLCKPPASAAPPASVAIAGVVRAVAVAPRTVTLHIEGMTCGGCVFGTRKVLTQMNGVTRADVSYEKSEAVVTYDDQKVTVEQMIAAIKTLGYGATVVAPAGVQHTGA